eukprot:2710619-Rhodomonas_salina.2
MRRKRVAGADGSAVAVAGAGGRLEEKLDAISADGAEGGGGYLRRLTRYPPWIGVARHDHATLRTLRYPCIAFYVCCVKSGPMCLRCAHVLHHPRPLALSLDASDVGCSQLRWGVRGAGGAGGGAGGASTRWEVLHCL